MCECFGYACVPVSADANAAARGGGCVCADRSESVCVYMSLRVRDFSLSPSSMEADKLS